MMAGPRQRSTRRETASASRRVIEFLARQFHAESRCRRSRSVLRRERIPRFSRARFDLSDVAPPPYEFSETFTPRDTGIIFVWTSSGRRLSPRSASRFPYLEIFFRLIKFVYCGVELVRVERIFTVFVF